MTSLDEPQLPARPFGRTVLRWLALIVVVAVLAIAARALARASATTVDGAFTLAISSPRNTYLAGEAITGITATLTYRGPAPATIAHAYRSPIGFGIVEPVNGYTLAPAWLQSCGLTKIDPDGSLTSEFGKSGASPTNDSAFIAFMQDPVLRLPAGTWHLYAEAQFSDGTCGGVQHDLRADITLDVR